MTPAPRSYRIAEVFHSLQGEGPSAGTPAHFIRLQGCDVGCAWCDTKYSWPETGGEVRGLDQVWEACRALGPSPLLVVTGGEPLQHDGITELLEQAVGRWPRVEVETSGIGPPPLSHPRLYWNVSPKLPSATPRWRETWAHVAAWLAEPNATLKVVVGPDPDLADAERLLSEHRAPPARVMLMPEGVTAEALVERGRDLAVACRRLGVRLSPRLHVWLWGARRGV